MHPQGLVVWATGVVTKPVVRQFIERFASPPPSPRYERRRTGGFEWGGVGFFSVKVGDSTRNRALGRKHKPVF